MNIIRLWLLLAALAALAALPALAQTQSGAKAPAMVVEVTADRHIVVAGDTVNSEELLKRVHAVLEKEPEAHILIRISGDGGPYEEVGRVIYTVYRAGAKEGAVQFERRQ